MRVTSVYLAFAALVFLGSAPAAQPQRFAFRAEAAERVRDRVVYRVRVENTGSEESELRIYGGWHGPRGSVLVDDLGTAYPAKVGSGLRLAPDTYIQRLVPGVPLTLRFVADSVRSEARAITLVIRAVGLGEPVVLRETPLTP